MVTQEVTRWRQAVEHALDEAGRIRRGHPAALDIRRACQPPECQEVVQAASATGDVVSGALGVELRLWTTQDEGLTERALGPRFDRLRSGAEAR